MVKRHKKAREVLKRYKAGERIFQGVDLQGANLKGKNLSDADFTDANFRNSEIQGTKFFNSTLARANFEASKAGLSKLTAFLLIGIILGLSVVAGFLAAFAGDRVGWYLALHADKIVFGILNLSLILPIILLAALSKGLGLALIVAVLFSAFIGYLAINVPFDGAFILVEVGLLVAIVTIAFAVAGARAVAGNWLGIVAFLFTLAGAFDNPVTGVFMLSGDISSSVANIEDYQVKVARIVAVSVIVFGAWIGWRAFDGDEKYTFIQKIAFNFATFGGTNFYDADLGKADFSRARLKGAIFAQANLTHTCWNRAENENIERIDPGTTYLNKKKVQNLVVGETKTTNFDDDELPGVNLSGRNLDKFSFIKADLSKANLQNAKLRGALLQNTNLELADLRGADLRGALLINTDLELTDLRGADLTGACIDRANFRKTTKLQGVHCEYIYMKYERKVEDKRNEVKFKKGEEFIAFISSMIETLDFYLEDNIPPEIIVGVLKSLANDYQETLQLVALEHRDKQIILKLATSESANQDAMQKDFRSRLDRIIELRLSNPRQIKFENFTNSEKKISNEIEESIKKLSPTINYFYSENTNITGTQLTMNLDQSRKQEIKADNFNNKGVGAFSIGDNKIKTTNSFNEYQNPENPDESDITILITQLKEAIKAEEYLDNDLKNGALKSLEEIEKAILNPKDQKAQTKAKLANATLRGVIVGSPVASALLNIWDKLEPTIKIFLGL